MNEELMKKVEEFIISLAPRVLELEVPEDQIADSGDLTWDEIESFLGEELGREFGGLGYEDELVDIGYSWADYYTPYYQMRGDRDRMIRGLLKLPQIDQK